MRKLKGLFWLLLFAAIVYAGFQFVMPQYRYHVFESDMRDVIRFGVRDDAAMLEKIMQKVEEHGIPVTKDDISLYRDREGRYNAKVSWSQTVDIFGLYSKTYDFSVDVGSQEMRK
jgi:hypothetical protein